jgi:hypothetical protein
LESPRSNDRAEISHAARTDARNAMIRETERILAETREAVGRAFRKSIKSSQIKFGLQGGIAVILEDQSQYQKKS